MTDNLFYFGQWQVNPKANSLRHGATLRQLEPKAMDVLRFLCQNAGEVVSADAIVEACWPNTPMGDNPIHKVITQLRKALDDNASNPTYIETIRKRGYRTLASITHPVGHQANAQSEAWQGGSPFPGLRAYEADDARVFFGRSQQIATLLDRITQQVVFGRAFCLVLGPSGSGKSSLINAGILPNLMTEAGHEGIGVVSATRLDLADVTSGNLFLHIASGMLDWEVNEQPVFDGFSAGALAELLVAEPEQVIARCKAALSSAAYDKPLFALFVDRLEVLLASPIFSDAERKAANALMEQLASSGVILVLCACRNDFYPALVAFPSLMAGKASGAHFDLAAPSRAELLQMIRLPALAANLTWGLDAASGLSLDDLLAQEAADNLDALPLLQYTLQELYLQRSPDGELLMEVFHQLGGIEGSIGKSAEQLLSQLPKAQRQCLPSILSLLVTLSADEKNITSRAARWHELSAEAERTLVQAMVENRLFVSHLQNNEPCFSLAHEALLRRWPRVTEWIEYHRDSLKVRSRLQIQTERWLDEQKSAELLLPDGKPLLEAQTLLATKVFSLSATELAFIAASSRRSMLKTWLKRVTVMSLLALTLLAGFMTYQSIQAQNLAQQKRAEAESLLGFMVGDFADKLRSVGRMDLLDGISNKALEYFSRNVDEGLSFEARFQHAQTLAAMGEVAQSRNNIDEARQAFAQANRVAKALLMQHPSNSELLTLVGANAFWLGQIAYNQHQWDEARSHLEDYLAYSLQLFELAPDSVDALREVFYAHSSLGALEVNKHRYVAAKKSFDRALSLSAKLLSLQPKDPQTIADHSDTLSWLRRISLAQGDIAQAKTYIEDIFTLLDQPDIQNSYNFNSRNDLVIALRNYSRLLKWQGDREAARLYAERAYKLAHVIALEDPKNSHWQQSKDTQLNLLISLQSDTGFTWPTDLASLLKGLPDMPQETPGQQEIYAERLWELIDLFDRVNSPQLAQPLAKQLSALLPELNQSDEYLLGIQAQLLLLAQRNGWDPQGCAKAFDRLKAISDVNLSPNVQQPFRQSQQCLTF
ncbi:winged helix-turn-helix domain-containing protein [Simiduia curdlanivorans]|uniref:Winged helix-turn-helix domain-containing protein n=1 Tax=Simiduia curdlanivorans TaxID=1492769 RepID=A0ABV8V4E9_9GAMM|nr:winged helix-turn-helix domain-containing protein [Simiduia curdlanivorans]MDN3640282.1 winged helix-turn-helix domain-containing protein [Simiduia curdlanivorans]